MAYKRLLLLRKHTHLFTSDVHDVIYENSLLPTWSCSAFSALSSPSAAQYHALPLS